jgi:hypothetical protein
MGNAYTLHSMAVMRPDVLFAFHGPVQGAKKMNNQNSSSSTITAVCALVIGVILLWSFGKQWLNFESVPVFLAGLIGVAVPVLIFGIWQTYQHSRRK